MVNDKFDYFKGWIKCEIEFQLHDGIINESDRTQRDSIILAEKIIENTDYTEDDLEDIVEYIEDILRENYKCAADCNTRGDYNCYYYNDKYDFETIEELFKEFGIEG